jgi:thiamine monophosphate kinase
MEKPMTTNVKEAKELHNLLMDRQAEGSVDVGGERTEKPRELNVGGGVGCFLINHSANYRMQARAARSLIQTGKLGEIQHGKSLRCIMLFNRFNKFIDPFSDLLYLQPSVCLLCVSALVDL